MLLSLCPRCEGTTVVADDSVSPACRWCGRAGWGERIRNPELVRRAVLADLNPVPEVLIVYGVMQAVFAGVHFAFFVGMGEVIAHFSRFDSKAVGVVAIGVVLLVTGVLIASAGIALKLGRGNSLLAVLGAWLMLASPLLLGLPFGVWALRKLLRPEARAAFARSRPE